MPCSKYLAVLSFICSSFFACDTNSSTKQNTLETKPNIVIILADDMGYGDVGFNGATLVSTPNMDRIAQEGMIFQNAYSPSSVCTPSRYALLTGRYAWRTWNGHKTVWATDPLLIDTSRLTLASMLKKEDYNTALIGKWHLGFGSVEDEDWDNPNGPNYNKALKPGPLELGFDYFFGVPYVGQAPYVYIKDHHIQGSDTNSSMQIVLDERWKSRISHIQRLGYPHHEFIGDESSRYGHEDMAIDLTEQAVNYIHNQGSDPFFLYFAHRNIHGPLTPHQRFVGTSKIGVYGDFLHELDWSVGQILRALEEKGLDQNTMVILASDNGAVKDYHSAKPIVNYNGHQPNAPFAGQKTEVYEGGVHVPMAVRWPARIESNTVTKQLTSLADIMPTLAELFQIDLPWNVAEDGFSFLPALTKQESIKSMRQSVVLDGSGGLYAIREGPWKFISGQGGGGIRWNKQNHIKMLPHEWMYPTDLDNPPGQLYNLEEDPLESRNLYYDHPEVVVRLRAQLRDIQYSGRSR